MPEAPSAAPAPARMAQGLRYAWISAVSLAAIALSESVLQNGYSLYLAFNPGMFIEDGQWPLAIVALLAAAGAWLDGGRRGSTWPGRAARSVLASLLLLGLFQVLRHVFLSTLAFGGWTKLAILGGLLALALELVWRWPERRQWRALQALAFALLTLFLLQPGMAGYLLHALSPTAPVRPADASTAAPGRDAAGALAGQPRVVVVVLDEWDMEVSERERLFDQPAMQLLLRQSLLGTQVESAGANTLSSVPAMLSGQPFDQVERGTVGTLRNRAGQRFDAASPQLFNDLQAAGVPFAVTGFYHDYCAVALAARRCHAEPVQLFPGWQDALERQLRNTKPFDYPYSDFMRQWRSTLERLQAAAARDIADPANRFVWVHLNIPHPPLAARGAATSLISDYRANLQAMVDWIDATRMQLQVSGTPAVLVLTSDHWLRERELWQPIYERQRGVGTGDAGKTGDHRVPLLVWFSTATPGDAGGLRFAEPIRTTLIRPLVPRLLDGRVQSPADLAVFLQSQRKPG